MRHPHHDTRTEAAIYWSAVSLIVCEGFSVHAAAERLGLEDWKLRAILRERRRLRPFPGHSASHPYAYPPTRPIDR